MSTEYLRIGYEIHRCDMEGCISTQDVTSCEICRKDVCCWHENYKYDLNQDGIYVRVCSECIEDEPNRFVDNEPISMFDKEKIIQKLKNKEKLDDCEIDLIIEYLNNIKTV